MPKTPEQIIKFLRENTNIIPKYCDSCGSELNDNNVQILGQKDGSVMCRTHCDSCGSSHMLNVAMPQNGVGMASRRPINVDLTTAEEFSKFAGKSAVDSDDAIDTHKSLDAVEDLNDFIAAISGLKKSDDLQNSSS